MHVKSLSAHPKIYHWTIYNYVDYMDPFFPTRFMAIIVMIHLPNLDGTFYKAKVWQSKVVASVHASLVGNHCFISFMSFSLWPHGSFVLILLFFHTRVTHLHNERKHTHKHTPPYKGPVKFPTFPCISSADMPCVPFPDNPSLARTVTDGPQGRQHFNLTHALQGHQRSQAFWSGDLLTNNVLIVVLCMC